MRFRNLAVLLLAGSIGISAVSQIALSSVSTYSTITLYSSAGIDRVKIAELNSEGLLTKEAGVTDAMVNAAIYRQFTRMMAASASAMYFADQVQLNACLAGWKKADDDLRAFATDMQRQLAGISKALRGGGK